MAATEDPVAIPGSRYVDWLIPGIVGLGIMSTSMWSIGFMTVQARMRKLLKRLVASPMRKREYLLAQVLARLRISRARGRGAAGVRRARVRHADSWLDRQHRLVASVGALAFGALGLLLGSRARTFEAVFGLDEHDDRCRCGC